MSAAPQAPLHQHPEGHGEPGRAQESPAAARSRSGGTSMHLAAGPQACLQGRGRGQVHGQGHGRRGFQKKRSFWRLESVETQREFRRLLRFGFGSRRGSGPRVKGAGKFPSCVQGSGNLIARIGCCSFAVLVHSGQYPQRENNPNIWSLT